VDIQVKEPRQRLRWLFHFNSIGKKFVSAQKSRINIPIPDAKRLKTFGSAGFFAPEPKVSNLLAALSPCFFERIRK
jgi:hypothetical protein